MQFTESLKADWQTFTIETPCPWNGPETAVSDELNKTIRFRRETVAAATGTSDAQPSTETTEFELVSTQMLEQILISEDNAPKDRIRELAESDDGWLAQDTESKDFEIVKDDELERALQSINGQPESIPDANFESVNPSTGETNSDLCLVSTQHLRQVMGDELEEMEKAEKEKAVRVERGFNPYNNA